MSTEPPVEPEATRAPFHRLAVISVLVGVLAFLAVLVEPMLGMMLSFPALTTAVWARREIADNPGRVRGFDLAGYGLALALATLLLVAGAVVLDQLSA